MSTYLVFGDLHGRILPAFRLALAWGREHGERLDGLLEAMRSDRLRIGQIGKLRKKGAPVRYAPGPPTENFEAAPTGSPSAAS